MSNTDKIAQEIAAIIDEGHCGHWGNYENLDTLDTAFAIKKFVSANVSHFEPIQHWSDCALHNGPALEKGLCTCMNRARPKETGG